MLTTLKSLPQTFFFAPFYAALVRQGRGIGLGFIVLLVLFSYAVPALLQAPALPAAQMKIEGFFGRLPGVAMKDAKLSIDKPSPYTVEVKSDDGQAFVIVFDTTYQETSIAALEQDMAKNKTDIFVTSGFVAIKKRQNGNQIEFHSFRDAQEKDAFEINHEKWTTIGKLIALYFPYIFVLALIPVFLAFLVLTFFKGLLVKLLALFFTTKPDLSGSMRLAAAAAMPPALINLLLVLVKTGFQNGLPGMSGFLFWLALAIFGLWSANRPEKA
jgi:hypothetical protein